MTDKTAGEMAIEALRMLSEEPLGDFIYEIRDQELEGWEGPRVTRWSKACELARLALEKADAEAKG